MKSLVIFVSLLAIAFGSLSSGPVAPIVRLSPQGGHYRVESKTPDGSVAGQYGYQTDGQKVQVTYATAGLPKVPLSDGTYTSGTTAEEPLTDPNTSDEVTTTLETKKIIPIEKPLTLDANVTPAITPLTYGSNYPIGQSFNYYYHVKPVTTGFYPNQQHYSYSHSIPYIPATGPYYYIPTSGSGQQPLYPQPTYTYTLGTTNVATSPVLPQTNIPITPQVFTGQAVTPEVSHVFPSGTPVPTGPNVELIPTKTTAEVFTGQAGTTLTTPVATPDATQFYVGQSGISGTSPAAMSTPMKISRMYSAQYRHPSPSLYYTMYRPMSSYRGFAQRYAYPAFHQYRTTY